MKISYNGVSIESASIKEAAEFITILQRKAKFGNKKKKDEYFDLPDDVKQKKAMSASKWTTEEKRFVVENMEHKPLWFVKRSELKGRSLSSITTKLHYMRHLDTTMVDKETMEMMKQAGKWNKKNG